MTNYYHTLGLKSNTSERAVFKAFSKQFLKEETSNSMSLELLKAYIVLSSSGRKFHDILLAQEAKNIPLNPKYIAAVQSVENKVEKMFKEKKEQIYKTLTSISIKYALFRFLELLLQVSVDFYTTGLSLMFLGLACAIIGVLIFTPWFVLAGLSLFILGYFSFKEGITRHKKERLDQLLEIT